MTGVGTADGKTGKFEDGRPFVRFDRYMAHPVPRIWKALTDENDRKHWQPGLKLDPRLDGEVGLYFSDDFDRDPDVPGKVTRFEAPYSLTWHSSPKTFTDWFLKDEGDGAIFTFMDVFPSFMPAHRAIVVGWHRYLLQLQEYLDTDAPIDRSPERSKAMEAEIWELYPHISPDRELPKED